MGTGEARDKDGCPGGRDSRIRAWGACPGCEGSGSSASAKPGWAQVMGDRRGCQAGERMAGVATGPAPARSGSAHARCHRHTHGQGAAGLQAAPQRRIHAWNLDAALARRGSRRLHSAEKGAERPQMDVEGTGRKGFCVRAQDIRVRRAAGDTSARPIPRGALEGAGRERRMAQDRLGVLAPGPHRRGPCAQVARTRGRPASAYRNWLPPGGSGMEQS